MIFVTIQIDNESDYEFMRNLYEENKRLMFSIAFCYTNNIQDCEDIVHDVIENLCKISKKLRSFSDSALRAYIIRSVQNAAINHQKHHGVIRRAEELFAEEECILDDPQLRMERIEQLKTAEAKITDIWDELSQQEQELLYRKYVLDQGTKELAEVFQCSRECIRMRLSRTRKKAFLLMEVENANDPA